jgi:hypothetical protein
MTRLSGFFVDLLSIFEWKFNGRSSPNRLFAPFLGPRCSIALRVLGRKTFLVKAHRIVPVVAFDCEVLRSTKGSPILAAALFFYANATSIFSAAF